MIAPSGDLTDDIKIPDIEGEVDHHLDAIIQQVATSDARLQEIKTESEKDETLKELSRVITRGWPKENKQCKDKKMRLYWDYRADLSVT